jgi:Zn-dependent M28 family amino/carboxypeptidase
LTDFNGRFVQTLFNASLTKNWKRSDYGPFIEVGIPAGGLATGAEGLD